MIKLSSQVNNFKESLPVCVVMSTRDQLCIRITLGTPSVFVWAGDECCPTQNIYPEILRVCVCVLERGWFKFVLGVFSLLCSLCAGGSMGLKQAQFCVPFDRQARFLILV